MIAFLVTFLLAFFIYLLLTAGSGSIGFWSASELIAGAGLGIVVAGITRKFLCRSENYRMVHPLRLLLIPVYILGPFLIEVTMANIDVAVRVITGRIRPGIIRVSSGLKTDLGIFMLANSITLTPGTITIDIDEKTNDLFVHNINIEPGGEEKTVTPARELFSFADIPAWIRRIAE
ncbi:MAG: Na+/H+ antiporter subunit E [Methanoregulaceae archaeon]